MYIPISLKQLQMYKTYWILDKVYIILHNYVLKSWSKNVYQLEGYDFLYQEIDIVCNELSSHFFLYFKLIQLIRLWIVLYCSFCINWSTIFWVKSPLCKILRECALSAQLVKRKSARSMSPGLWGQNLGSARSLWQFSWSCGVYDHSSP